MRYVFLSLLLFSMSADAQICVGPMNPRAFGLQLQQLRGLPNDAARLRAADESFSRYCLTSTQVFQVCRSFGADQFRVDFAAMAYDGVLDPQNFYDVYDALDLKSSAFRLHDIISGNVPVVMEPVPLPEPLPEPIPVPVCEVTASDMAEIKNQVKAATFKDSMESQAKMMIKSKQCFRADQIVELLKLLTYDDSKLNVAKFAYDFCVDTQNYFRVVNAFTFKSYQDDLTKFIDSRN